VPADLRVRLHPRARRNALGPERGGVLRAEVTAPPVDDRANQALRRLIAKRAGVASGRVVIVRGAHARDKVVRVGGLDPRALREALGLDRYSARG
jgi:uncharacterized protein YggU (UPF0235/DUF167 family)